MEDDSDRCISLTKTDIDRDIYFAQIILTEINLLAKNDIMRDISLAQNVIYREGHL